MRSCHCRSRAPGHHGGHERDPDRSRRRPARHAAARRRAPHRDRTSTARSASTRTASGSRCTAARIPSPRWAPATRTSSCCTRIRAHGPPAATRGCYHFALLYPSREELARAVQRLALTRTPISGASDHGVSEAIYLADPDGNGIELYADRPREAWPPGSGGRARGDVHAPRSTSRGCSRPSPDAEPPRHAGAGPADGPRAPARRRPRRRARASTAACSASSEMATYPGALFLAAGGYHHHLGLNTWRRRGRRPGARAERRACASGRSCSTPTRSPRCAAGSPPPGSATATWSADPWGIRVRLSAAAERCGCRVSAPSSRRATSAFHVVVRDGAGDDHVVSLLPVDRG